MNMKKTITYRLNEDNLKEAIIEYIRKHENLAEEAQILVNISYDERLCGMGPYEYKVKNPSDDVIGHMISVGLSRSEVEGLIFVLFSSGRDSIAYMISTSIVALLENRDQYEIIRNNLPVSTDAVEELMRYCSMFVTLFPRTALEDIKIIMLIIVIIKTAILSRV